MTARPKDSLPPETASPEPVLSETILLVDDEEGIRTVLSISLADMGYRVLTAACGEEALRLFVQHSPTIVISDIKMPGISGIELLDRIKATDAETEVIMITGHGDLDLAIQSLKRDAADFVTKPISEDALEIALRRARERIDMRRERRERAASLERLVREQSAQLVEAERQLAAVQAVHGLSHALKGLTQAMDEGPGVFNELPCFVSLHDRDLRIIAVNDLYRERLGDLVGKSSCEAYAKECAMDCPAAVARESGRGYRGKRNLLGRSGQPIPAVIHAAPILDNEGEVELIMEIAVDVTEAQKLREELRRARHRWEQLFDEAPCYITVQDRDLRIQAANRRFREDFGEAKGRHCHQAFAHRQGPCQGCPAQLTLQDGQSHQLETVVASKSGEPVNVLIWSAAIRDGNGQIEQVMEMSTNITQLRMLQDRLTTLGLLMGSAAHGVKGLLTALDGAIYRLGSGLAKGDSTRMREGYEDINHLSGRVKKMVLDVLYYAKKRGLAWSVVDGPGFVRELVALVEPKASARRVRLALELDERLGSFEADASALSSAVVNILENAVDACDMDHCKDEHLIRFQALGVDGHIELKVADNGVGMDQATRERLFTLFFSSKGSAGTGLGLFVAGQIIKEHGGSINVDSEPGQGTTFIIRLPRTLPEAIKTGLGEEEKEQETRRP